MAEENKKRNLGYDWHTLELSQVAASYFNQAKQFQSEKDRDKKNSLEKLARKSVELMFGDIGYDPLAVKTMSGEHGIKDAIPTYLGEYQKQGEDQTVKDLLTYHNKGLEKYVSSEDLPKVQEELAPFMDVKYEDILNEVSEEVYIIGSKFIKSKKNKKYSEKDIKNAEKTMAKYQKVILTISMLEDRKLSELKNGVEDEATKDKFKSLYFKPDSESEDE